MSLLQPLCIRRGALRVALVQYFPGHQQRVVTERSTDQNFGGGDTFSLGSSALIWQLFRNLVLVSLKEEQYQYVHTHVRLEKPTVFGNSGYSGTRSHCSASIQSRLIILFLFRKSQMIMYVTDLLFSSEN